MVDTTDSKSVASNRVRVQVSSPVSNDFLRKRKSFFFNHVLWKVETELRSRTSSREPGFVDNPKMTAGALIF